ncbi:MAG TPA: heat-inducible transcriptional repressor HrcA [Candidatus Deferrimicrobiaceae bacterium]|nr:heat-inducible transcriptional repressor HrcA [Candidatus Deferrimicrobiaceae bacterium]
MNGVLDDRGAQVLRHVVEDYIETAEPVGSRTISKKMGQQLSPATIRNIMADLEEMGYLVQPHTSAGRVPTSSGFRYYVDYLLARRKLARPERDQLQRMAAGEAGTGSADEVVRQFSRLLSSLSQQACVVVVSRLSSQPLRSLNLLHAGVDRILLVSVTQAGWVEHRLIEGEKDLSADDLVKINAYLNELAAGLSLPQMRVKILQEMKKEKMRYDRLMRRALLLGARALDEGSPAEVYVEGRANILDKPEFVEDVQKLKRILRAFEEKSVIVRLLDRALEEEAIQVSIGTENPVESLPDISVVASGYRLGESTMGSIGLIGPVRMDYSHVIPLVEYSARLLSSVFEHR